MSFEMAAWSKNELKAMRRVDAPNPPRRRFMTGEDLFHQRAGVNDSAWGDRADNLGRRYNVLLMALRQAKPQWPLDAVRAEAQRQLKLEDPNYRRAASAPYER